MRLSRLLLSAVIVSSAAIIFALSNPTAVAAAEGDVAISRRSDATEVHRIHAHFDSVLRELGARPVTMLTAQQRASRDSLVRTLLRYNARGVFPHNYDFPGRPTPYFVDRNTGTLCAVAYLLASTGRRDMVDRVAQANNNVWVAQLAGDSALTTWLDQHGLTLAEAARIQVPYVEGPTTSTQQARNVAFIVATPFALGGAVFTSVWNGMGNANGQYRVVSGLGLTSGVALTGLGTILLAKSDLPGAARGVGGAGAALGALTVALSVRAMHRRSAYAAAVRESRSGVESGRRNVSFSLAPLLPMEKHGVGLAGSIRF